MNWLTEGKISIKLIIGFLGCFVNIGNQGSKPVKSM